jgi:hypothetical protein
MFKIAKKEFQVKTDNLLIDKDNEQINNLFIHDKKFDLILIDVY